MESTSAEHPYVRKHKNMLARLGSQPHLVPTYRSSMGGPHQQKSPPKTEKPAPFINITCLERNCCSPLGRYNISQPGILARTCARSRCRRSFTQPASLGDRATQPINAVLFLCRHTSLPCTQVPKPPTSTNITQGKLPLHARHQPSTTEDHPVTFRYVV